MSIQVVEVESRGLLKRFLRLPDEIYRNNPHYIKPLDLHTRMMLGALSQKNKNVLLAMKDGRAIARVAAKVHAHGPGDWLHFGFFECAEGEKEAAQALFAHLQTLYPRHGLRGPYHFRMEDPYVGNLVQGHDQEPFVFMPYSQPFYDEYLRACGLDKAVDLLTYKVKVISCPEQIRRIAERGRRRGVGIRWLNPKDLKNEVRVVADIFNDALSENWGFEPITDDQLDEMFMLFKYIIDPRLVCFTVKDGRETGCVILLPDLNPVIATARGRLTPSFLWRLFTQRRRYKSTRGYALGMRKGHEGSGNVCQLIEAMYDRAVEIKMEYCEISWVLENNRPMTELSQSIGGFHNKTYRVYERAPSSI